MHVYYYRTDTPDHYTLEFVFDSDVDCCFRVLYSMPDTTTIPTLTNEYVPTTQCVLYSLCVCNLYMISAG